MDVRLFRSTLAADTTLRRNRLLLLAAVLVAIPCGSLLAVEVSSLRGPIYGVHEWRQGWTYSVAYAFVHESASFFYPKHAWRGHLTGIVGMEMPIYPYLTSLLMRAFSDSPVWGRLLNFALFSIAFGLQAQRLGKRCGGATALGFVVMLAFSPMVLSEFRQVQPDPLMTALAMLAAVFFQDHAVNGRKIHFAAGVLFYSLALLTKSIAIAVLPAMFSFAVLGPTRVSISGLLLRAACFAPALVALFSWDQWANELVQRYMEGRSLISIDHDPARMWSEAQNAHAQRTIFLGLLENWVTHCVLMPAVMVGAVDGLLRRQTRGYALPFLIWFVGVAVIALAFSSRYFNNWYYMLLFAPPLAFYGAIGLGAFFEVICFGARDARRLALGFILVVAGALVARELVEVPWDRIEHVHHQLAVHVRQQFTSDARYWRLLGIGTLGGLGLLGVRFALLRVRLLSRVPDIALSAVLAGAAVVTMSIPYRDVRQTVRFYTGELEWEAGWIDQGQIRAAVDRYSTPRDLFVMNGANPAFFVRALRVGFADDAGWIDALGRASYVAKGARFFMSFQDSGGLPTTMQDAPLLERGPRWELFCIDPNGCPRR